MQPAFVERWSALMTFVLWQLYATLLCVAMPSLTCEFRMQLVVYQRTCSPKQLCRCACTKYHDQKLPQELLGTLHIPAVHPSRSFSHTRHLWMPLCYVSKALSEFAAPMTVSCLLLMCRRSCSVAMFSCSLQRHGPWLWLLTAAMLSGHSCSVICSPFTPLACLPEVCPLSLKLCQIVHT